MFIIELLICVKSLSFIDKLILLIRTIAAEILLSMGWYISAWKVSSKLAAASHNPKKAFFTSSGGVLFLLSSTTFLKAANFCCRSAVLITLGAPRNPFTP